MTVTCSDLIAFVHFVANTDIMFKRLESLKNLGVLIVLLSLITPNVSLDCGSFGSGAGLCWSSYSKPSFGIEVLIRTTLGLPALVFMSYVNIGASIVSDTKPSLLKTILPLVLILGYFSNLLLVIFSNWIGSLGSFKTKKGTFLLYLTTLAPLFSWLYFSGARIFENVEEIKHSLPMNVRFHFGYYVYIIGLVVLIINNFKRVASNKRG